ncbi:PrsW family intramembrane metalloprotease [Asanoa sp. WMMD1127]|uniref:PrsW family intramembrane metalloprotease n=1 Tax=Asanoa sp. WMMD1127 TaxID=3016107 RepID=UPI0024159C23|nr:PrsW family intramembrane metalloprotease [Asanoa sp. WMMD1127]MDG4821929.1 PrsW family intramembrane metalloprotease [Asanoa sp. WMMD1127]
MSVHPTPEWARAGKSLLLPAFWVVLMLIAGGAVRLGMFVRESFALYPAATLTALILFGLYAVPFCVFVAALDYLEREPPLLLATAFAWGGLVATSISIRGNAAVHNLVAKLASPGLAAEWGSALAGPTVEEIAKALGIIAIVLVARAQVNSVLDGVVYGSLVGLGFQVVEDVVYAVNAVAVAGRGDQVAPVIATFLLRGFLAGLWSHTLFGALAGAGIGYLAVRTDRNLFVRVSVAVLSVLGAMAIHFVWNSPLLSLGGGLGIFGDLIVKGIPPLLMILLLVRGVRHREADYYMGQLAALGDRRIATEDELRVLASGHLRAGARRYAHGRAGVRGRRAVARLQRAQARLAVELSRSTGGARSVVPPAPMASAPVGGSGVAVGVAHVPTAPIYVPILGGPKAVRWRDRVLFERARMHALGHAEATAPLSRNGNIRRVVGGVAVFLCAMFTVGLSLIALGAS